MLCYTVQRELHSSHGPQSSTAQPGSRGHTHGYTLSTCRSSLKRQLALLKGILDCGICFLLHFKNTWAHFSNSTLSKQLSHGKAGNGRGTAGSTRQALSRLSREWAQPQATRVPGAFEQCPQGQGGILRCPVKGQGLDWMILVGPFLNEDIL